MARKGSEKYLDKQLAVSSDSLEEDDDIVPQSEHSRHVTEEFSLHESMQRLHARNHSRRGGHRQIEVEEPNPKAVKATMALFKKNKGIIEAIL